MFIELNYNLLINSVIQLTVVRFTKKWGDWLSIILAISAFILSLILPFVFAYNLVKLQKLKSLNQNNAKRKYGELYNDLIRGDRTTK